MYLTATQSTPRQCRRSCPAPRTQSPPPTTRKILFDHQASLPPRLLKITNCVCRISDLPPHSHPPCLPVGEGEAGALLAAGGGRVEDGDGRDDGVDHGDGLQLPPSIPPPPPSPPPP